MAFPLRLVRPRSGDLGSRRALDKAKIHKEVKVRSFITTRFVFFLALHFFVFRGVFRLYLSSKPWIFSNQLEQNLYRVMEQAHSKSSLT